MKAKIRIARLLQYLLFFIPVKKNRIMFYANNRKGYVCNPSVLMESFWLKHPGEYELIWVTRFPETCTMRTGITVVRQRSLSYFKLFLRCGIFITNDMIDEALVKKRTCTGLLSYKRADKNFAFCAKFSDDCAGKRAVRFTLFIGNH